MLLMSPGFINFKVLSCSTLVRSCLNSLPEDVINPIVPNVMVGDILMIFEKHILN